MYIWEKIQKAINSYFIKGDSVRYREIIDVVTKKYPEIKVSCILPSDLCDNHKNKDSNSGKHKIFHKTGIGKYEVL